MFRSSTHDINCGFFNQDASRLAVGTMDGYMIMKISPDIKMITSSHEESTSLIHLYYNTGLIAHVGGGSEAFSSQRCMKITNVRTRKEIIRMSYSKKILAVRINRRFLVLASDESIRIYDMGTMKLKHTISSPPANPNGVLALATCHVLKEEDKGCRHLLCYPKSNEKGDLFVYDVENQRLLYNLEAHTSPVACVAFNNRGSLLATASEKGTKFRVFATATRAKLYELRRGYATRARVLSMNFCPESKYLCVSSEKATVHVFKTDHHDQEAVAPPEAPEESDSWSSYFTSGLSSAVSYFAPSLPEMWTEERSFAMATLDEACENTSALVYEDRRLVLIVFTSTGDLYKFWVHEDGTVTPKQRVSVLSIEREYAQGVHTASTSQDGEESDDMAHATAGMRQLLAGEGDEESAPPPQHQQQHQQQARGDEAQASARKELASDEQDHQ
ncbi:hypothetical protein PTSG_11076 [Salpingoeca rosetta]|uniref:WD repeat domain phosphoinositide-interacting protein 2 n=1 Tax=Salpingoeca rosetta (strain ATCC 50818 / BSB-021) TaxID=946362 RepID=F2US26_SALR5|nr:uncharacterized protein PTSG_11076 [Salpingoeca rosetta]EGD80431.1 hypothetical protein PTSG_11076 [Salpingoeca rosetta]|eukprot:XP_004987995.1 hypothetical protein PTSG_11076 [Salpingoeca rosetta]